MAVRFVGAQGVVGSTRINAISFRPDGGGSELHFSYAYPHGGLSGASLDFIYNDGTDNYFVSARAQQPITAPHQWTLVAYDITNGRATTLAQDVLGGPDAFTNHWVAVGTTAYCINDDILYSVNPSAANPRFSNQGTIEVHGSNDYVGSFTYDPVGDKFIAITIRAAIPGEPVARGLSSSQLISWDASAHPSTATVLRTLTGLQNPSVFYSENALYLVNGFGGDGSSARDIHRLNRSDWSGSTSPTRTGLAPVLPGAAFSTLSDVASDIEQYAFCDTDLSAGVGIDSSLTCPGADRVPITTPATQALSAATHLANATTACAVLHSRAASINIPYVLFGTVKTNQTITGVGLYDLLDNLESATAPIPTADTGHGAWLVNKNLAIANINARIRAQRDVIIDMRIAFCNIIDRETPPAPRPPSEPEYVPVDPATPVVDECTTGQDLTDYSAYLLAMGTLSCTDWIAAGRPSAPPPDPEMMDRTPPEPEVLPCGNPLTVFQYEAYKAAAVPGSGCVQYATCESWVTAGMPSCVTTPPAPVEEDEPCTGNGQYAMEYQAYLLALGTLSCEDWINAGRPSAPPNHAPEVRLVVTGPGSTSTPPSPTGTGVLSVSAVATDEDGHDITYRWFVNGLPLGITGPQGPVFARSGSFIDASAISAPAYTQEGNYVVRCVVEDELGDRDSATVAIRVSRYVVAQRDFSLSANPVTVDQGDPLVVTAVSSATSPYAWGATVARLEGSGSNGTLVDAPGTSLTAATRQWLYTAPSDGGTRTIRFRITVTEGSVTKSVLITVNGKVPDPPPGPCQGTAELAQYQSYILSCTGTPLSCVDWIAAGRPTTCPDVGLPECERVETITGWAVYRYCTGASNPYATCEEWVAAGKPTCVPPETPCSGQEILAFGVYNTARNLNTDCAEFGDCSEYVAAGKPTCPPPPVDPPPTCTPEQLLAFGVYNSARNANEACAEYATCVDWVAAGMPTCPDPETVETDLTTVTYEWTGGDDIASIEDVVWTGQNQTGHPLGDIEPGVNHAITAESLASPTIQKVGPKSFRAFFTYDAGLGLTDANAYRLEMRFSAEIIRVSDNVIERLDLDQSRRLYGPSELCFPKWFPLAPEPRAAALAIARAWLQTRSVPFELIRLPLFVDQDTEAQEDAVENIRVSQKRQIRIRDIKTGTNVSVNGIVLHTAFESDDIVGNRKLVSLITTAEVAPATDTGQLIYDEDNYDTGKHYDP